MTIRNSHKHLPRLEAPHYRGFAVVHWSLATRGRQRGWLNTGNHERTKEILIRTMMSYELLCPAYCLMPDHVHVMWMGVADSSDQLLAMRSFRRHTATLLGAYFWQKQAYDHVLREEERKRGALAVVCRYILENPVRAGLCEDWQGYLFSGAILPESSELNPREADYWEKFWALYAERRERAEARWAAMRGGHAADSAATSEVGARRIG